MVGGSTCNHDDMHASLQTAWQGNDLLVLRDEHEIDRIPGTDVRRVILVCRRGGETPGDLAYAVIETDEHHVLLPDSSGIAGRVHFERQAFWAAHPCVYWVAESQAPLPRRLRAGLWLLRRPRVSYARLPRAELAAVIEQWPLEGPQSWEQRKWERIVKSRLIAPPPQQQRR